MKLTSLARLCCAPPLGFGLPQASPGSASSRVQLISRAVRPTSRCTRLENYMDSIPDVIDALERAPRIVIPLVREVPGVTLKRRPAPRKWSAHEHACHLAVVHKLFLDRLDYMLSHPEPVISRYDPGTQDPDDALLQVDLNVALAKYGHDRELLVSRLRALPFEDWQRTAEHGEYSH